MLEGKAMVADTDMPSKMQIQAMSYASQALDLYDVLDCESIAAHIKKVQLFHTHNTMNLFCRKKKTVLMLLFFCLSFRSLIQDMVVDGNVW